MLRNLRQGVVVAVPVSRVEGLTRCVVKERELPKRPNSLTRFVEDIVDDTKGFVEDVVDDDAGDRGSSSDADIAQPGRPRGGSGRSARRSPAVLALPTRGVMLVADGY